jgi:hypothetical protein
LSRSNSAVRFRSAFLGNAPLLGTEAVGEIYRWAFQGFGSQPINVIARFINQVQLLRRVYDNQGS